MDPAVAALDFAKAGAIIANMIESYLAAGATPLNAEGAEHAEREDCRSSFGTASLHLHSPVDDGTSASQSGEHRASVQSSEPSEVARLDSGADPFAAPSNCSSRSPPQAIPLFPPRTNSSPSIRASRTMTGRTSSIATAASCMARVS